MQTSVMFSPEWQDQQQRKIDKVRNASIFMTDPKAYKKLSIEDIKELKRNFLITA